MRGESPEDYNGVCRKSAGFSGSLFACLRSRAHLITCHISTPTIRKMWRSSVSTRSEEHTSELQSPCNLVCRLLLEKKKKQLRLRAPRLREACTPAGRLAATLR